MRNLNSKWVAFWVLRVLWFQDQTVYLQTIFTKVQQWLQLPDELMADGYDSSQTATGSRVEHQMRWSLTALGQIGFVQNTAPGEGGWAITDAGRKFLEPLRTDPDQTELNSRPTHPRTFIEMTNEEENLQSSLHKRLSEGPPGGSLDQGPSTPPTRPDDWPRGLTRSRGAPPPPAEEVEERTGSTDWASARDRRAGRRSRSLVARFEGNCVKCLEPINIGDRIAIAYRRDGFVKANQRGGPLEVEGWRHDRCSRGGAGDRARVSPPGNPPRRSDIRRRLFLAEGDD